MPSGPPACYAVHAGYLHVADMQHLAFPELFHAVRSFDQRGLHRDLAGSAARKASQLPATSRFVEVVIVSFKMSTNSMAASMRPLICSLKGEEFSINQEDVVLGIVDGAENLPSRKTYLVWC